MIQHLSQIPLVALLIILLLVACASPRTSIEIVQAFIVAIDSEKLDAAYKLLTDEFIIGYGGGEEETINKAEVRLAAEKIFKEYNFDIKASNFQDDGERVYFSITISSNEEEKSVNCTCEATIIDGLISRLIILFCNAP